MIIEVFMDYLFIVKLAWGVMEFYINISLKQSTYTVSPEKIYAWLVIYYSNLCSGIIFLIIIIYNVTITEDIEYFMCFLEILITAVEIYIVQSYYRQQKLAAVSDFVHLKWKYIPKPKTQSGENRSTINIIPENPLADQTDDQSGYIPIFIASICYICYYIWEYNVSHEVPRENKIMDGSPIEQLVQATDEVFLNYITLVFMLVGFTSLFASFGLRQATLNNAAHKIYLWLLIACVQFGTVVTLQIVVLFKHTSFIQHNIVGFFLCFVLIDAALVFQILVVQSFYKEEKLIEETNYSRLRSDLTSQIEQHDEEEFQNVDL
ncbi:hypothetical protein ACI65C_011578 [Semiaphis heraclei]